MEKDDEVKGGGNSYDFGARMYDSRLGRFLSIDDENTSTPFYSPYLYAANCPIRFIDVNGDFAGDPIDYKLSGKKALIIVLADGPNFKGKVDKMYMEKNGRNRDYIVVKDFADASELLSEKSKDHKYETLTLRFHAGTSYKATGESTSFMLAHGDEWTPSEYAFEGRPHGASISEYSKAGALKTDEFGANRSLQGDPEFENKQLSALKNIITFTTPDATVVLGGCNMGMTDDSNISDIYNFVNEGSVRNIRTLYLNWDLSTNLTGNKQFPNTPKMGAKVTNEKSHSITGWTKAVTTGGIVKVIPTEKNIMYHGSGEIKEVPIDDNSNNNE